MTSDFPSKTSTSYLLFSKSVICDSSKDSTYQILQILFYIFIALWPIFIFGSFAILLYLVKPSVMKQKPSELAIKCRFLWADYDECSDIAMYWDLIDFLRKLTLVGFLNFIHHKYMLRLTIAVIGKSILRFILIITSKFN